MDNLFDIGDTVSLSADRKVGVSDRELTIPKGSKAFVCSVRNITYDNMNIHRSMYAMRLFFGLGEKFFDLWEMEEWRPNMCRMVLIEKVIPVLQFDEDEMSAYGRRI